MVGISSLSSVSVSSRKSSPVILSAIIIAKDSLEMLDTLSRRMLHNCRVLLMTISLRVDILPQ